MGNENFFRSYLCLTTTGLAGEHRRVSPPVCADLCRLHPIKPTAWEWTEEKYCFNRLSGWLNLCPLCWTSAFFYFAWISIFTPSLTLFIFLKSTFSRFRRLKHSEVGVQNALCGRKARQNSMHTKYQSCWFLVCRSAHIITAIRVSAPQVCTTMPWFGANRSPFSEASLHLHPTLKLSKIACDFGMSRTRGLDLDTHCICPPVTIEIVFFFLI